MTSDNRRPCLLLAFALLWASSELMSEEQPSGEDAKNSRRKLEKAATSGDAEAQFQRGVLEQNESKRFEGATRALTWFCKVERRHAEAWLTLGHLYAEVDYLTKRMRGQRAPIVTPEEATPS